MIIGFGAAGALAAIFDTVSASSLIALARLILTSILLGAVFLALGYMVSALAGSSTGAAGMCAGVWLVFVVLYDLGLLGALVADAGGWFTESVFPWAMIANPADAFRIWNVASSEGVAMAEAFPRRTKMIKPVIATTALLISMGTAALAEDDADKGKRIFNKCKACHAVGEGAKNKIGPVLNGIVNNAAGENGDFKYSDVLLAMAGEGLTWDEANLTAFLTKPKDFMDGTKMAFAGLRKNQEVLDVIAYLKTFE